MNVHLVCPQGHTFLVAASRLGGDVACPHCFSIFHATIDLAAQKNARARDSDEDDEDEQPQKKSKSPKAKKDDEKPQKKAKRRDDEDEKPQKKGKKRKADDDENAEETRVSAGAPPLRKKKPARKKDEDDDDEEDDDEKPEKNQVIDDEDEIIWTPRKRQLQKANLGLLFFQISYTAMTIIFAIDWCIVAAMMVVAICALFDSDLAIVMVIAVFLMAFIVLPAIGLLFVAQLIAWVLCLFAPSKAEVRGSVILAMIFFFGPVLLYLVYFILVWSDYFRNQEVSGRFLDLMNGGAVICGLISFFCGLVVLKKIGLFMSEPALSNQPVTLGWFIIGGILLRMMCFVVMVTYLKLNAGTFGLVIALVFAVLSDSFYIFVLRSSWDLVKVCIELRKAVNRYITDS